MLLARYARCAAIIDRQDLGLCGFSFPRYSEKKNHSTVQQLKTFLAFAPNVERVGQHLSCLKS